MGSERSTQISIFVPLKIKDELKGQGEMWEPAVREFWLY